MNLFLKELKFNRKALIIWSIAMIVLVAACITKFDTLSQMGSSISDVFNGLPKIAKAIFGIGNYDIMSICGYYCMIYYYLVITIAIHAIILGAGILSKEQKDRTSEFLMAKPMSRNKIITMKLFAALFNILVVNIVTTVSVIALNSHPADLSNNLIIGTMAAALLIQVVFLSIGLLISVLTKKEKGAGSIAAMVIFIMFFIAKFIEMVDNTDFLKFLTPFKYFEADQVFFGNGFQGIYFVISAVIIVVALAITYVMYNKRDLTV